MISEANINAAGTEIVRRTLAKWGAGWLQLTRDAQRDQIAASVLYSVVAQDGAIEVSTVLAIMRAAWEVI
jgi:hypothetical protein